MQESIDFLFERSESQITHRDYIPLRLTAAICLAGSLLLHCVSSSQAADLKWHNREVPAGITNLTSCAYGNGTFVVTSGDFYAGGPVLTSPDGVLWQVQENTNGFAKVGFGDGAFWATSHAGVFASTNGIDWNQVLDYMEFSPNRVGMVHSIAAAEGHVIIAAESSAGVGMVTSTNGGVTWNLIRTNFVPWMGAATVGNGLFVGAFKDFSNPIVHVLSSSNTTSWTAADLGGGEIADLIFVNSMFVGLTPESIFTSADGLNWITKPATTDLRPFQLAYGDGFFATSGVKYDVGGTGRWAGALSTNLNQWTPALTGLTNLMESSSICYGAGTFVSVGGKTILQSDHLTSAPPTVTLQPKSTAVYEGGTARFNVSAFGTEPLTYQWRHNQVAVPGATATSLTITNAQLVDAGSYDVVVSNELGTATSASAWLNVSWVTISRYAGVKLTGEVGSTVKVDYVDSLTSTNWLELTNVVLPSNPYIWIDYESPDHPARFYRATRQ